MESSPEPETNAVYHNVMAVADRLHRIPEDANEELFDFDNPEQSLEAASKRRRVRIAEQSPPREMSVQTMRKRLEMRTESPERVLIESVPSSPVAEPTTAQAPPPQYDSDSGGSDYETEDTVRPPEGTVFIHRQVSDDLYNQITRYCTLAEIGYPEPVLEIFNQDQELYAEDGVQDEVQVEEEEEEEPEMTIDEKITAMEILSNKLVETMIDDIVNASRDPQQGFDMHYSVGAAIDKYPYEITVNMLENYRDEMMSRIEENNRDYLNCFFIRLYKTYRTALDEVEADAMDKAITDDPAFMEKATAKLGECLARQFAHGQDESLMKELGVEIGNELFQKLREIKTSDARKSTIVTFVRKERASRKQAKPSKNK